jgi:hypothetical protein
MFLPERLPNHGDRMHTQGNRQKSAEQDGNRISEWDEMIGKSVTQTLHSHIDSQEAQANLLGTSPLSFEIQNTEQIEALTTLSNHQPDSAANKETLSVPTSVATVTPLQDPTQTGRLLTIAKDGPGLNRLGTPKDTASQTGTVLAEPLNTEASPANHRATLMHENSASLKANSHIPEKAGKDGLERADPKGSRLTADVLNETRLKAQPNTASLDKQPIASTLDLVSGTTSRETTPTPSLLSSQSVAPSGPPALLTPASHSPALPVLIANPTALPDVIVRSVFASQKAIIQIDPPEMGRILMDFDFTSDHRLIVSLSAETDAGRQALIARMDQINALLREQLIGDFSVQIEDGYSGQTAPGQSFGDGNDGDGSSHQRSGFSDIDLVDETLALEDEASLTHFILEKRLNLRV